MSATADHYDIVVIGSGPGGASAAQRLAPTGKHILMLERGDYLPRSRQNWDSKAVFVDGVYQTKETWYGAPYAYPAVKHEPRIQQLNDILLREGLHPFHLPLGIKLDQNPDGSATTYSPCIRCDAFDGFPCAINAQADAHVICVDPTRAAHDNFTLLTNTYVTRLETDATGRSVSRVHVIRDNQFEQYTAASSKWRAAR
jgi:choline dehydrogenase-like flavoprotein